MQMNYLSFQRELFKQFPCALKTDHSCRYFLSHINFYLIIGVGLHIVFFSSLGLTLVILQLYTVHISPVPLASTAMCQCDACIFTTHHLFPFAGHASPSFSDIFTSVLKSQYYQTSSIPSSSYYFLLKLQKLNINVWKFQIPYFQCIQ